MRNKTFVRLLSALLFFLVQATVCTAVQQPLYWRDFDERRAIGLASEQCPWVVSRKDIQDHFGYYQNHVSSILLYRPAAVQHAQPLVFFVVHGTWAHAAPEYFDPNDSDYQKTLGFVTELAHREQRPVEMVSFLWSGQNTVADRRAAGSFLRILCETFYTPQHGYGPRWAFGHSHGGNVIAIASQEIDFETAIMLGTPVLEDSFSQYRPRHIRRVLHLYSINDPFQYAGSFDQRSFFKKRGNGRYFAQQPDKQIVNMRVMFDSSDPGHVSLRAVWPQLWDVLDIISTRYIYHNHFDINLFLSLDQVTHRYQAPLVAIREDLKLRDMLPCLQDGESGLAVARALAAEIDFSHRQERLFASHYSGRSIHKKCAWWRQWVSNWREASDVLVDYNLGLGVGAQRRYSLLKDVIE